MGMEELKDGGWRTVVPATSANLGCAFDCGGLALKLYLQANFVPSRQSGLTIEYRGSTPERFPFDQSNLVLRSLRYAAEQLKAAPPAGKISVESEIPIGVGLGSSAAAVVAGLLLGSAYAGVNVPTEQFLKWAEHFEGHIDNAAAAYHGGLVFALSNNIEKLVTLKTRFPETLSLVVVIPAVTVATHKARQVLPTAYSREDVLHTLQRTAALVATCFAGDFQLFPELFDDRLHQPYRQQLVPGIERCLRFKHPGLLGIAISGSGSSVLAFVEQEGPEIAKALEAIFAGEGLRSSTLFTTADNNGASVTRGRELDTKYATQIGEQS